MADTPGDPSGTGVGTGVGAPAAGSVEPRSMPVVTGQSIAATELDTKKFDDIRKAVEKFAESIKTLKTNLNENEGVFNEQNKKLDEANKRFLELTTTLNNDVAEAYDTASARAKAYRLNMEEMISQNDKYTASMKGELLKTIKEVTEAQQELTKANKDLEDQQKETPVIIEKIAKANDELTESTRVLINVKTEYEKAQLSIEQREAANTEALRKYEEQLNKLTISEESRKDLIEKFQTAQQRFNQINEDGSSILEEEIAGILEYSGITQDATTAIEILTEQKNKLNALEVKTNKERLDSIGVRREELNIEVANKANAKEHLEQQLEINQSEKERLKNLSETKDKQLENLVALEKFLALNISLKEVENLRNTERQKSAKGFSDLADRILGVNSNTNLLSSTLIAAGGGLDKLGKSIKENLVESFLAPEKAISRAVNFLHKNLILTAFEFDKTISQVNKTTGGFGMEFEKVAFKTQGAFKGPALTNLSQYGIGIKELASSYGALSNTISNFNTLSESQKRLLTANAAQLEQLGLSASEYGTLVGRFMGGVGKTAEGAKHEINMLAKEAIAAGRNVAEYAKEFSKISGILSGYGREARQLFKELNAIAKQTSGLVNATDLSGLSEQFSTFDDAADSAAKLNAALRGNYISFTDMLKADPSERILKIVQAFKNSGTEFNSLNIGYQRMISESLGFGKDTQKASALLKSDMSKIMMEMNKSAASEKEKEERMKRSADAQERLSKAIESMKVAFEPAVTLVGKFADFVTKISNIFEDPLKKGIVTIGLAMAPIWLSWKTGLFGATGLFKKFSLSVIANLNNIRLKMKETIAEARGLSAATAPGAATIPRVPTPGGAAGGGGGGGILGGIGSFFRFGRGGGAAAPPTTSGPIVPPAGATRSIGSMVRGAGGFLKNAGKKLMSGPGWAKLLGVALLGGGLLASSSSGSKSSDVADEQPDNERAAANGFTRVQGEGGLPIEDAHPLENSFLGLSPQPSSKNVNTSSVVNNKPTIVLSQGGESKKYLAQPDDRVIVKDKNFLFNNDQKNVFSTASANIASSSVVGGNSISSVAPSSMQQSTFNNKSSLTQNDISTIARSVVTSSSLSSDNKTTNIGRVVPPVNNITDARSNKADKYFSNNTSTNITPVASPRRVTSMVSEESKKNKKFEEVLNKTAEYSKTAREERTTSSNQAGGNDDLVKAFGKIGQDIVKGVQGIRVELDGENVAKNIGPKTAPYVADSLTSRYG